MTEFPPGLCYLLLDHALNSGTSYAVSWHSLQVHWPEPEAESGAQYGPQSGPALATIKWIMCGTMIWEWSCTQEVKMVATE